MPRPKKIPEYWSRDAYFRLKQWVFERGGRLMYLGGNGIDCEVELPNEASMRCRTWLPAPAGVPHGGPPFANLGLTRLSETAATA